MGPGNEKGALVNKRAMRAVSMKSAAGILTVCVLGLLPAGCGGSASAESDKQVQQASDEAARLMASAGAYRPTAGLEDRVKKAGWEAESQGQLAATLKKEAPSGTGADAGAKIDAYMNGLM